MGQVGRALVKLGEYKKALPHLKASRKALPRDFGPPVELGILNLQPICGVGFRVWRLAKVSVSGPTSDRPTCPVCVRDLFIRR